MTVGGRVGALWIGGLEPYMDEVFLQVSFPFFRLLILYSIMVVCVNLNHFAFFKIHLTMFFFNCKIIYAIIIPFLFTYNGW
jgi:hypothetical protein